MNEVRYSSLIQAFPLRAEKRFAEAEEDAKARYEHLQKLVELFE
jgi:pyruvate-ferredoxin/flavodoxin oxidoreductase